MQKVYAWLRPRHYDIDFGVHRRTNSRGLLHMAVMLSVVVGSALMGYQFKRPQPIVHAQSAPVVIAGAPQPAAVAPAPPAVKPVSNYAEVAAAVQQWIKAHGSAQWGVAVQDLNEADNTIRVNDTAQFESASLYKLFLTIPLAQRLPFTAWQSQRTLNGTGDHTYAQCVQAMLALSDNPCGEAIGAYIGWNNATRTARANGFAGTSLSNSPIRTTATDVAGYLVGLEQGKWFDEPTRGFILDSLAHQKFRAGIPAGCVDCTVLNKTGQLNGVTHDAAIITSGKQKYVLVIMSKGGTYQQIAELTRLINGTLL